ncbi:MAG: biopolymer transporter ExbD [Prevotellaceae bacterium]|jgi:biopolymer transport protein ExbD|nr:biopolymer transporter ExbD [Prevotellaceae bacterium]
MAIKRRLKADSSFSMASMSDIVFLLLIFFLVTSTLINPNALNLLLPKSTNQVSAKRHVSVGIKHLAPDKYEYSVDKRAVPFSNVEPLLRQKLMDAEDPTVTVYADMSVPIEELVKVMNIAKRNSYKSILATSPE